MSARTLLEELRRRGVRLEVEGGHLHVNAPAGVLTEELRASLVERKPSLMKLLQWKRERERRKLKEAGRRGLIVRWSEYPDWIKLHDPLSGEWHEVRASECLPGIVETANKYRKRGGVA